MESAYILKTDYFKRPSTWIKRWLEFFALVLFLGWVYYMESEAEVVNYPWVKYVLFLVIAVFIFARQQDELAVDRDNLYYIKKSLVPWFTKTTRYNISKMKSIGCGGVYEPETEFLGRARATDNRLEIIFKDNSSRCHDVAIYKTELKEIVTRVQWLINENRG